MPVGRASDALLVNVSVTASGPRTRTFRLQLGDPAAVDGRHGEAEALHVDRVPDLRDAAQTAEDHPADGVVRLVGEIEAEPLARVGQRHEAVDEEGAALLAEERTLAVELVLDLADELLDDVLEGDESGGAADLVDHDREGHALAAELGERAVEVGRLGEVERLAHELAHRALRRRADDVLHVDDPDDVVEVLAVDRDAGEGALPEQLDDA